MAAVKAGNTFVTVGPLVSLFVDGMQPGGKIQLPATGGTVNVGAAHGASEGPDCSSTGVCADAVAGSATTRAAQIESRMIRRRGTCGSSS